MKKKKKSLSLIKSLNLGDADRSFFLRIWILISFVPLRIGYQKIKLIRVVNNTDNHNKIKLINTLRLIIVIIKYFVRVLRKIWLKQKIILL